MLWKEELPEYISLKEDELQAGPESFEQYDINVDEHKVFSEELVNR